MESNAILSAAIVQSRIEQNQYTVTQNASTSRRSDVWKIFKQILNENGESVPNFFACSMCGKVLKQHGTGTTNFKEHKCTKSDVINLIPPLNDEKDILNAATSWILEDGIPFSKIEGNGFIKFVSEISRISQKYKQPLDINATLPSRATLSRAVTSIYNAQMVEVYDETKNVSFFRITTDI